MFILCLALRMMDLPIRRRRAVSASSRTTKASSTASACLSSPWEIQTGRSCSSRRTPIAAAAVQVRSHDGWGLPSKQHGWLEYTSTDANGFKNENKKQIPMNTWPAYEKQSVTPYRSLCIADAPVARDMQGRSSSPQTNFACSYK